MKRSARFLMCRPDYYSVEYVINPWMEGNVHRSSPGPAAAQWNQLHTELSKLASIELINPEPGLPDMVFTANAGLVAGGRFVPSRFFHAERRGEEPHFRRWCGQNGLEIAPLPADLPFEGAGDAFFDPERHCLWAAYGSRTELTVHPLLAEILGVEVISLRLVDSRFYHLDTCFCLPGDGWLFYYPAAFDADSRRRIEEQVPDERRVAVSEPDALQFACNAVAVGRRVVLNRASDALKADFARAGFSVSETPLTEFVKSGGAAKCLVLDLEVQVPEGSSPASSVVSRQVKMEGHLLNSGLLERALDLSVEAGGTFNVGRFDLGRRRQSPSRAEITISAPSEAQLERIALQLVELGADLPVESGEDAELERVTQPGVAPEGFYATVIYPTEVRIGGRWLPVDRQRMDGVIVVDAQRATCRLFRDLRPGERVVVGSRGIRTRRAAAGREAAEFAFMGAGVSSERRVELVVERVAWQMRRIRERGGKIVVVAGPVVIHTGGGAHLAWLIRHGYVQVLLGGNAIAVHDIEQALLGTSLGVDLDRGIAVRGGHRHHLAAINTIRRSGGIEPAVRQGVLTSGVMYECIRQNVPFSLAGSIRDDGPLPETRMNLLEAQEEYARLIVGAEMILMLSSMLHSIGVGNMTRAGVRLVCVDINPAVVTKLMDRGSLESKGVVTDVGLFLSLLERQLRRMNDAGVPAGALDPLV